jgi:hypothetical protein
MPNLTRSNIRTTQGEISLAVLAELEAAVSKSEIIVERNQLQTYECDGLAALRTVPGAVVLPRSAAEVQDVVRICARHHIPFVARGAGTGLSGGALPNASGIVIGFARMNRILAVDIPNQRVTVEPGVINAHVYPEGLVSRLLLRSRSVFPDCMHHRRKRGRKCRRGPLPEVWLHYDSRACAGRRSPQR